MKFFLTSVLRFIRNQDGVTTVEWLALAGAALVGGVAMTWVATSNFSSPTTVIESRLNAAASQ